jgi:hypothetical protein
MKAIILIIRKRVMEFLFGKVVAGTKDNLKMIRDMVKALCYGLMVKFTKVIGSTEYSTVMASWYFPTAL